MRKSPEMTPADAKRAKIQREFLQRMGRQALLALVLVVGSLLGGMAGFHHWSRLAWLDAFLNASMILTGMGPVDRMTSDAGKLFAAVYALYSGVAFLGIMGILVAPWAHRLLHHFHVEDPDPQAS